MEKIMSKVKPIVCKNDYNNFFKKNYIAIILVSFFICFLSYRYILMKYYKKEYNVELEDIEFKKNKIIELLL